MVKADYKQTEIGLIPIEWDVKSLGEVVNFTNGKAHESEISDSGSYVVVNSKFISTDGEVKKYSDKCYCPTSKNNILMVMSDVPNGRAIAKCFYVDEDDTYTVNQRICSIEVTRSVPKYIFYQLNRNPYYLSFDDGVKQTNLRKGDVLSCPLAIPQKPQEQQAIAEALSDVDALITGLDKLIAKKRDVKTAVMQVLLTGEKRLPGFGNGRSYKQTEIGLIPEDWVCTSLASLLKIRHGKSQHDIVSPDGKYPILATGGVIGRTNTPLYSEPSVLIGRKGTIDVPRFMDTPFWTVDTLFYSEIYSHADPKFIFYKFCLIDWYSYNEASGVPSLNAKTIENIIEAFPKSKNEQQAISQVLTDMDAEITALETRRAKTQAIKQGMMQELLTGRTRLL